MDWDDWKLLLLAVREGSMTAGAQAAGVGQATMSRRIAQLEARVGHLLLNRSRQGLSLTEAGQRLLPHAQRMAEAAQALTAAAESMDREPAGLVTVTMPPGIAIDLFAPALPRLRQLYPRLRIRMLASTDLADLDSGEADVAIRLVRPQTGELVIRRLGVVPFILQASRAYVAALPSTVRLVDLDWITWTRDHAHLPPVQWLHAAVPGVVPVVEADDFLVQRAAAEAGVGVLIGGPTDGLVQVPVRAAGLPTMEGFLVLREALRDVPRVRAVADFIVEMARTVQGLRAGAHNQER